mmetsp:Transcript_42429/g.65099  ORF Transcript_42429/g.65099 Transcript_42429/m.65099 type:complete len:179 (-) Transcript_42429:2845-3381(-)
MVKSAPGGGNVFAGSRSASPDDLSVHSKNSKKSTSRMRNAFTSLIAAMQNYGKDGREPYQEKLHTKEKAISKLNLMPVKLGQKQPAPSVFVAPPVKPVKPKLEEKKQASTPPKVNFEPNEEKKELNKNASQPSHETVIEEIWESVEDEMISKSSKLRQQQRINEEATKIPESASKLAK